MKFLVEFDLEVPEGDAALARKGHLERLWRPPLAAGRGKPSAFTTPTPKRSSMVGPK
jgi:hypothetical protein